MENFSEQMKDAASKGHRYVLTRKTAKGNREALYSGDDIDEMNSYIRVRENMHLGDGVKFLVVDLRPEEEPGAEMRPLIDFLRNEGFVDADELAEVCEKGLAEDDPDLESDGDDDQGSEKDT
jgi:hypothetical protein